tara:strand:+ start:30985 stop:31167 length:183 start_codon:yes stop_codon:yes gene_type:complete
MVDIEYESNNKAITDKYCNKVIDHKPVIRSVKKAESRETRLSIELILEQRELKANLALSC